MKFPCHMKLDEDVDYVDWARLDTLRSTAKYIYRSDVGMDVDWRDRRFTVIDRNHSHTLVIHNVIVNDSAYYRCVENSESRKQHSYSLTIQGSYLFVHIILLVSRNYCTFYST